MQEWFYRSFVRSECKPDCRCPSSIANDTIEQVVLMENPWIAAARFLGIGWLIVLCIFGGLLGGRWVGQQVGSEAVCTMVGLGVGMVLGGYGIYASYLVIKKSQEGNNGEKEK